MRIVIQRVKQATVHIDHVLYNSIGEGLLLLLGIEETDTDADIDWLTSKVVNLRIFDDHNGIMNRSICEMKGQILVISQFTLHAATRKGNRPSYIRAATHAKALPMYEQFCKTLELKLKDTVKTGVFAANMQISLINDGPVTILIDTKNKE